MFINCPIAKTDFSLYRDFKFATASRYSAADSFRVCIAQLPLTERGRRSGEWVTVASQPMLKTRKGYFFRDEQGSALSQVKERKMNVL